MKKRLITCALLICLTSAGCISHEDECMFEEYEPDLETCQIAVLTSPVAQNKQEANNAMFLACVKAEEQRKECKKKSNIPLPF